MLDFKFQKGDKVFLIAEAEDERQERIIKDIRYTASEGVVYVLSAKHLDIKKQEIIPAVMFVAEDEIEAIQTDKLSKNVDGK